MHFKKRPRVEINNVNINAGFTNITGRLKARKNNKVKKSSSAYILKLKIRAFDLRSKGITKILRVYI